MILSPRSSLWTTSNGLHSALICSWAAPQTAPSSCGGTPAWARCWASSPCTAKCAPSAGPRSALQCLQPFTDSRWRSGSWVPTCEWVQHRIVAAVESSNVFTPTLRCSLSPVVVHHAAAGVTLTALLFARGTDCVLVGDSEGKVTVYQLKNFTAEDKKVNPFHCTRHP